MRSRAGVSLVEVLVAAVLLAIGVGGSLSAFGTALRLRTEAAVREARSARAQDRLTWFTQAGCAVGDTLITAPAAPAEQWRLVRDAGGVRLSGVMRGARAGVALDLRVEARVACE